MNYKRQIGLKSEEYALTLLKEAGYQVVSRNYRNRFGEIDIIAFENDTLVFIEVKFRSSCKFGLPEEAVGKKKLEKIRNVGYSFWRKNFPQVKKVRVDVVSIERLGQAFVGRIIKNVY